MLKKIKTAVILAGGKGTRLSEQTKDIPKPLVSVGGEPIIVHIMRRLAKSGIKNFYILGGYKYDVLWSNFYFNSLKEVSVKKDHLTVQPNYKGLENTIVHVLFTGQDANTAERIKQVEDLISEDFIITYGDSYSDIDVSNVEEQFYKSEKVLTLTAIPYVERFGVVKIDDSGNVLEFREKQAPDGQFINGGFICAKKNIFDFISKEDKDFSSDVMQSDKLSGKISVYKHYGYWKAVDSQKDLDDINKEFINKPERFK